jgi:hypothetical protein
MLDKEIEVSDNGNSEVDGEKHEDQQDTSTVVVVVAVE